MPTGIVREQRQARQIMSMNIRESERDRERRKGGKKRKKGSDGLTLRPRFLYSRATAKQQM